MKKWMWYILGAIALSIVGRVAYKEYLIREIIKKSGGTNVMNSEEFRKILKENSISELRAMLKNIKIS